MSDSIKQHIFIKVESIDIERDLVSIDKRSGFQKYLLPKFLNFFLTILDSYFN